jgi:hypothetical protein
MAEKLRAAMTSLESSPFCNFREVLPDGGSICLSLCSSGLSWPFFGGKRGAHGALEESQMVALFATCGLRPRGSRFLPSLRPLPWE